MSARAHHARRRKASNELKKNGWSVYTASAGPWQALASGTKDSIDPKTGKELGKPKRLAVVTGPTGFTEEETKRVARAHGLEVLWSV